MKIFLTLCLLFVSFLTFADEVINTPYGQKTVIIPISYEELKKNYLTLSGMYFEQKYDLEQALVVNDDLIKQLGVSSETINSLRVALTETEKQALVNLEAYNTLFRKYEDLINASFYKSVLSLNGSFDGTNFGFGLNYFGLVTDSFFFGVGLQYPIEVELFIGLRL